MKLLEKVCLFVMLAIFTSCSDDKDDIVEQQMEEESNYYALTVGNSWTYDLYRKVSQSNEFELKDFRLTTTITGTENINGEEYFVLSNTSQGEYNCPVCDEEIGNNKVRDSLGYLIDSNGIIKFDNEARPAYLISSSASGDVYGEYEIDVNEIQTPAGLIDNIKSNRRYLISQDGTLAPGQDRGAYRENKGLVVRETAFITSGILQVMVLTDSTILE